MESIFINRAVRSVFEKKAERLTKKAKKAGLTPFTYYYGDIYELECTSDVIGAYKKGKRTYAAYQEIFLEGEAPVIEGYTFMATVDLRGAMPVVRRTPQAPADVDLNAYFETDSHCDHCDTKRARNDVLVLRNDATGELIQIGRNCAADFFRSKEVTQMLRVMDYVEELRDTEDMDLPKGASLDLTLMTILAQAAAVKRVFGWVSKSMAHRDEDLIPSSIVVADNLYMRQHLKPHERADTIDEDWEKAREVMKWVHAEFLSKETRELSEFGRNVVAVIEEQETDFPTVRQRNVNYVSWMVNGYDRAMEKKVEQEARAQVNRESTFVGEPKQRLTMKLKLEFRRDVGGFYGPKALCKFRDEDGNVLVWFATGEAGFQMQLDHEYLVKATVKEHSRYNDVDQTVLTRVSVLEGDLG